MYVFKAQSERPFLTVEDEDGKNITSLAFRLDPNDHDEYHRAVRVLEACGFVATGVQDFEWGTGARDIVEISGDLEWSPATAGLFHRLVMRDLSIRAHDNLDTSGGGWTFKTPLLEVVYTFSTYPTGKEYLEATAYDLDHVGALSQVGAWIADVMDPEAVMFTAFDVADLLNRSLRP